jgi:hypothetical protein
MNKEKQKMANEETMKLNVQGLPEIELNKEQAQEAISQIFAFIKKDVVGDVMTERNLNATDEQIEEIASKLFDEIHDNDDMYWDLEEKNVLWLAGQMGLCDFEEVYG